MVALVWGGGEGVLGEGSPPPLVFNYSKEALGGGGVNPQKALPLHLEGVGGPQLPHLRPVGAGEGCAIQAE